MQTGEVPSQTDVAAGIGDMTMTEAADLISALAGMGVVLLRALDSDNPWGPLQAMAATL